MQAQQIDSLARLPEGYLSKVSSKANSLEQKLDHKTDKLLASMQKQEEKIFRKVARKDSLKAVQAMGSVSRKYDALRQQISDPKLLRKMPYNAYLDTLKTSLKFLDDKALHGNLSETLGSVEKLEDQFKKAEAVKKFVKERKQQLKEQLGALGMLKDLKRINKAAYYYAAQVQEYKQVLSDPKKIEEKALSMLRNLPAFKDFMNKNSELASMFRLPGSGSGSAIDLGSVASLQGLQTRAMVSQQITQQLGGRSNNVQALLQQNLQAAQGQLSALKAQIPMSFGNGSSDMEVPDFKPNSQKTKSFMDRLEYGANIQSQRSTRLLPTSSELGLTLGYKLNDKSTIGIGGSYRWGWGKDIQHIKISHEGVGVRSYLDYQLKGSFWLTGGYERMYNASFKRINELKNLSAWQESGLIGLKKKQQVGKVKGDVQLLWDFLSYRQVPRGQAVKFRVGWSF
ncbi:MAG: hypothetical protein ACO1NW_00380 [Chitinophagaceae bacterium]